MAVVLAGHVSDILGAEQPQPLDAAVEGTNG